MGQTFVGDLVPLPEGTSDVKPVADGIPTGAWRDGLCDCCMFGPCHAMCCLSYWFGPGTFAVAGSDGRDLSMDFLMALIHSLVRFCESCPWPGDDANESQLDRGKRQPSCHKQYLRGCQQHFRRLHCPLGNLLLRYGIIQDVHLSVQLRLLQHLQNYGMHWWLYLHNNVCSLIHHKHCLHSVHCDCLVPDEEGGSRQVQHPRLYLRGL